MARAERPRGRCCVCSKDCAITEEGGVRHHFTEDPEQQAGPDSRKCRGVGQPPAAAETGPQSGLKFLCRVPAGPAGCGHEVQLTANHRSRSHLDPQGERCAGGSDHPIAVDVDGFRADTADWDDEQWARVLQEDAAQESADAPNSPVSPDLPHDRQPDPHRREADIAIAEAERVQREDDAAYAQSLRDGIAERARARRVQSTVANQLGAYRAASCTCNQIDVEGPARDCPEHGETPAQRMSRLTAEAIEVLNRRSPEEKAATAARMDATASAALGLHQVFCEHEWQAADVASTSGSDELVDVCKHCGLVASDDEPFDVAHDFSDEATQTYGVHPGEAADCRLPGCCTHPRGFAYVDDENGLCGSFCPVCGAEEPEPCSPHELESVAVDGRPVARCAKCWRPWAEVENEIADWKTPADELAKMPPGIRAIAESNPECWRCGHEISPVAESFDLYGKPKSIVWNCWDTCYRNRGAAGTHPGEWCTPQLPQQGWLGHLEAGDFFVRHTAKAPLDRLVYRLEDTGDEVRTATVVSAGPYAGRTGQLTKMTEHITCTDQSGTPRPRRGHDTSATSRSKKHPHPLSTPSPSVPTARPTRTVAPTTAPSSGPGSTPSAPSRSASGAGTSKRATSSRPTVSTATSTRSAPVPDAFATAKQAASESDKYDRFGRYKLVHPHTGKPVKWTRATTYAKSIADTYNLSMWSQRMTLKGAAVRPDIVAAVSTLDVKADRDRMNALVEDAKKAAGNKVAANLGTALHSFTEDRDKVLVGQPVKPQAVPENLLPSVDAYEALLVEFGLRPVPGLIEFTTAVLQYEIAGTSDRCYLVTRDITFKLHGRTVTLYAGEYVIGDVKSGADLSYGWMEICIQLAIYAQGFNSCGVWDWNTGTWGHPALAGQPDVQIKVRTDVGLIPHLPVDRKEGDPLATLFAVDLDWGWATAVLCGQVRTARKEGNLATALTVADVAEPGPEQAAQARNIVSRPPTLKERARAVTTQAAASALWKEAVAARTPKSEVDQLVLLMKKKLESHVEQGA